MNALLLACTTVLAVNLALGLVRLSRGSEPIDRLAAAQLVGTVGVAQLLLLAEVVEDPSLRLVALVIALLGAVSIAAFLRVTSAGDRESAR